MTGARFASPALKSRSRRGPANPGREPRPVSPPDRRLKRSCQVKASSFVKTVRTPALVYVVRDGSRQSVVHEMLARGFARVSAHVGDRPCAEELLARERAARQAKLGLWREPYYAIVTAESWAELIAERGHFTVVEGKVSSVRESGGTIYVNFGRRWSQALTVTILKRHERSFTAAGMEPKRLENRRVRVRGWVEDRNGPRIEATRPEQIEIAEGN